MNHKDTEHPLGQENDSILSIRDLIVHYVTEDGVVEAVNNISMDIQRGKTYGLIGETGAGKTTIALSIMGLLPVPPSKLIQGEILFNGEDLLRKSRKEMKKVRGKQISMIFQDPMSALNPVHRVGDQIAEVIRIHQKLSKHDAVVEAEKMLQIVGIPAERYRDYPHEFSGGMKQRVIIAMSLACQPELIIADEPTTALDVTIQAQVLELIKDLQKQYNTSMLLITHDFGIVADICDSCAVIYAGEIVEYGSVEQVFRRPLHPYTQGLFASLPSLSKEVDRLTPIPGLMADPMNLPECCSFAERCSQGAKSCTQKDPVMREMEPGHFVKCLRYCEKEDD